MVFIFSGQVDSMGQEKLQSGWDRSAVLFSFTLMNLPFTLQVIPFGVMSRRRLSILASQMSLWSIAEPLQFLEGDPITMTKEDILDVHRSHPTAQIVATHLEAVNHCLLTRASLQAYIQEHQAKTSHFCP